MAILVITNSGHTAIATAVKDKELFIAWGELPPFINPPTELVGVVNTGLGGGLNAGIYEYVVTAINEFGETLPSNVFRLNTQTNNIAVVLTWTAPNTSQPITYSVYGRLNGDLRYMGTTSETTFTDMGLVISSGKQVPTENTTSAAPWGNEPKPVNFEHKRLYKEICRRKIQVKKFVVPDANGVYATSATDKWSESVEPTRHVYYYVAFDLSDAATSTVYQYGIYMDTVPIDGYHNANYLLPDQVASEGKLLCIQNSTPKFRNPSSKEIHEGVLTF